MNASEAFLASRFASDCILSQNRIADIVAFARRVQSEDIDLALVAAPMPGSVIDTFRDSGRYDYIWAWLDAMKTHSLPFLDAFDIRSIGAEECEFLDYWHGGEVAYLRVLRALATRSDLNFRAYVDLARIDRYIAAHSGQYFVADNRIGDAFRHEFDTASRHCQTN